MSNLFGLYLWGEKMSDFMEYAEYYKKAWEKSLKERTSNLQAEIDRLREALLKISVPDPIIYDGVMAYKYKMIAHEALKGKKT
jgi:hypothetical protein